MSHVGWPSLWITGLAYLAVVVFTLVAILRSGSRALGSRHWPRVKPYDKASTALVGTGITLGALLLVVLMVAGVPRHAPDGGPETLVVQAVGHPSWWDFEYPDSVAAANAVSSPNVLHLPVGMDVRLDLSSHAAIHSLWVPDLSAQRDLAPGHDTQVMIRPTRVGTFVGQCAESSGLQPATMRFLVVVEPRDRFERWRAAQGQSSAEPATAMQRRGRQVFLSSTCVMCHAVTGTAAASRIGPDLTHVGSRPEIAAATVPSVRDHLALWITDPQGMRPGVLMPVKPLAPADVAALVDYLESLR